MTTRQKVMQLLASWQKGQATPAEILPALEPVAESTEDWSNLGAIYRALGRLPDAEAAYRKAIALAPRFVPARYNLGNALADRDPAAAADSYRAAVALEPGHAQAWNGLGTALQRLGHMAEAEAAFRSAVGAAPDWVEARTNLGVALLGLDRHDAAQRALQEAIALDARHAPAHGNLAAVYLRAGCPIAAEQESRAAIALSPLEHRWLTNLAVALQLQGQHEEAERCYRDALAMNPGYAAGHGNLLFAMNYRQDLPAEVIFAEYQRWDAAHAKPLAGQAPVPQPTAGRRLRVGYVSPDFRTHAVALFAEPLLAARDKSLVELFCYAEVPIEDETTARFRGLADHWRSTVGLDDAAVAAQIRRDGIDVLVDLGGHTASSRLLVFAYRPAPVQVAYLLGHGYTSGLSAMDVFIADEHLAPPGSDNLFSEQVIRLHRPPIVYAPPAGMPDVGPLPALTAGHVTFGYFGRTERINDAVIAVWSRVLHAIPDARLVLNNRGFQETAFRKLFAGRFAAHGIPAERLDLIYTSPQPCTWVAYGAIDIALDPFPHNAGTTTIEALWQGVPVVTLAGRPTVGRFGASILHTAGLADWITQDTDSYVQRAVSAARDLPRLAALRDGLRCQVARSPLLDARSLARAMERHFVRLVTQAAAKPAQPRGPHPDHLAAIQAYHASDFAAADKLFQTVFAATPNDAEARSNHAAVLRRLGRLADAEASARAALALTPGKPEALNNLGNVLRDRGNTAAAIDVYRQAVQVRPDFADAWANLAWVQAMAGLAQDSEASARQAIATDPKNANGHNNLGLALMRQSRLREAEETLRRALALQPGFALAHSNVLFCLNYRDDLSAEEIFAEYQRWDAVHARPLLPQPPVFELDRTADRPLRVGYVSPDFRHHAVALFAEPILQHHDHTRFEVFCYAEVLTEDATTARFRGMADHWRSTVGLDDASVAAMIRADRIDVLIDMAGHTGGNRLLAFARKPAPVQVEFMLGHGYTSGLSAMDAFLADEALAPPGAEALFSEQVVRLPRIPLAYRPPEGMPPVDPLPALAKDHVTFGYFGRTVRLTDAVVATWARILQGVPGSRLMLNSAPFSEPAGRNAMQARFAVHDIPAERLELVCTAPQPMTWAAYGQVDIALDPFPHNAGTTTIEALWQGVPVLSLAGRPTVGRFGAAILHAVGLDEWLTEDVDTYVARAVAAASNLPALAALRAGLRDRFIASPLCDAPGLTRAIETAYRDLWETWREGATARMRRLFAAGDRAAATALAEHTLIRRPDDPDALHVLGLARHRAGDLVGAIGLLQRAPARADILSDLGVLLRAAGRFAEAEAAYRNALSLQPDLIPALGNLGNLLLDQRRPDEACAIFYHALQLAPGQPKLMHGRAQALAAMGQLEAAD